jgi:hypothetical protein
MSVEVPDAELRGDNDARGSSAGNGRLNFQADIPKSLLMGLQENHLLFLATTSMNGVTGQEYRFAPEAAKFIVGFFEQIV